MTRKETTEWLYKVLYSSRLSSSYVASEVVIDVGTSHPRRIDVMEFQPQGVVYPSGIEKGIFICYEIKSCIQDVYSGNGLNFIGEKNYIVTTMETYKKLLGDMPPHSEDDKLGTYYKSQMRWDFQKDFGIMVAAPKGIRATHYFEHFEDYKDLAKDDISEWSIQIMQPVMERPRKRSLSELLFCMLRASINGR